MSRWRAKKRGTHATASGKRWARTGAVAVAGALLLAPASVAAIGQSTSKPHEGQPTQKPVALVSYYDSYALPRLLGALDRSGIPGRTPVFVGNYWGSPRGSFVPRAIPPPAFPSRGGRRRYHHAPILPIRPGIFWETRRVTRRDSALLRRSGDALSGRMPSMRSILRGGARSRRRFGRELGRRFRDRVRAVERDGRRIAAWQFDEIISQAAGRRGRAIRQFTRGILVGLTYGRPSLGDRRMRGFVWVAQRASPLFRRRLGGFWRLVDRATLGLVGEEYVKFVGSPRRAAARYAARRRRLARGGGARASLARKYIVGMTPGYRRRPGLGGNVRGMSRGRVNRWRNAFIRARARTRVAGFAEYNFIGRNGTASTIRDATQALARGVRLARRARARR